MLSEQIKELGYKPRKWDNILTGDEVNFAESMNDLIYNSELPLFQIKLIVELIFKYDSIEELNKSFEYEKLE